MSTIDSDLEASGYFLPGDSQLRLKKLREYVGFLAHLARPRRADESQEWAAAVHSGEVAVCLELLEEQLGQVLDELSWLAGRGERTAAREAGAEVEAEPQAAAPPMDEADSRYAFGVTVGQIDAINLLIDMLRAHGDVVAANDAADFAVHTLSTVGNAIFSGANKLREIILDVEAQRLDGEQRGSRTGVRDERGAYHVLSARLSIRSAARATRQLPTYQ